MDYRLLGRSDLTVSSVGIGCNNFGGRIDMDRSRQVIYKALDLGVNFFDTAPSYGNQHGSEIALGQFLGKRRQDIVLATKFGADSGPDGRMTVTGSSRADILRDVDNSLRRLKTDWIDLYQQHRRDPDTPIEETLGTLAELVKAGKIRWVGTGSVDAAFIDAAADAGTGLGVAGFISCQEEYNLLNRDAETDLMPALSRHGMVLFPYFPLASGLLTGKYRRGEAPPPGTRLANNQRMAERFMTDDRMATTERLIAFAGRTGATPVEVAISWLLTRDPVSCVIAGASTADQVVSNVKAGEFVLTPSDLATLDEITD